MHETPCPPRRRRGPAARRPPPRNAHSPSHSAFPKLIALPDGWQPEGIAIKHKSFYVGSIPTGAVYRGDLRTGQGAPLVPAHEGRAAIGLKVHHKQLWVAGGPTGKAFVYDARTGADVAEFVLASGTPFINDVAVGRREAYFTNSRAAEVLAVPLRGGPVRRIAIGGDFVQTGAPTAHQPQRDRRRGAAHDASSCRRTPASSSPPTRGPAWRARSTSAGPTCSTATAFCCAAARCSSSRTA